MTVLNEPRLPKVGEVWVWKTDSNYDVIIKHVDSDWVYYKFNEGWGNVTINVGVRTLHGFLRDYLPPKPKPREVWINIYPLEGRYVHDTFDAARKGRVDGHGKITEAETVLFREVL